MIAQGESEFWDKGVEVPETTEVDIVLVAGLTPLLDVLV